MDGASFFQTALDSAIIEFDERLDFEVGHRLNKANIRLGVIETITAGYVTQRLSVASPHSVGFGLMCPDTRSVIQWCSVKASTIREYGLGSMQVAEEMLHNVAKRQNCEGYLVVTGHWGPPADSSMKDGKGIVHIVLNIRGHKKTKTFPVTGSLKNFPVQATQSVLLVCKEWLDRVELLKG